VLVLLILGIVITGLIKIGFFFWVSDVCVFVSRLSAAPVIGFIRSEVEYTPVNRIKRPPKWN